MNLEKLRDRLASMQGQKKDAPKDIWKPKEGKHTVRIVPSAFDKENPFKEMYFYYDFGKTMPALTNYGEKDPIVETAKKLRLKGEWQNAKKIEPKLQVFAPVIVRGEEEKGVRLWQFSKSIYTELLKFAADEEVGDFTDPVSGYDVVVEVLPKEQTGKLFNTTTIKVSRKQSQLSKEAAQVKTWLTQQPNPIEIFTKPTFDELKDAFDAFLSKEDSTEEAEDDLPWPKSDEKPTGTSKGFSLETSNRKADEDIEDLFKP